jgi:aldehyde dehydrogenase (NAD+)
MLRKTDFYIDGKWVAPETPRELEVINPADEQPCAVISMGSEADVDKAVAAAGKAFKTWSRTSREERVQLLENLLAVYEKRSAEMAKAISMEVGAPITMSTQQQVGAGTGHIKSFIRTLKNFEFEAPLHEKVRSEHIVLEPIGVCGLITPWNWPMNQIALKVVPAVAAGCTCILKPSEISPLNAILFAEMMHEAGFPAGVFNLVNGDGPTVGEAMSRHPGIAMMSFTGSTRAGIAVQKAAAETVKRVTLELGGKSPTSCSPMPTSPRPSSAARCTCSTIPASRAMPRRACWWNARSMTRRWRLLPKPHGSARSATRLKRATTSDRWFPRCSSTRCSC